LLKLESKFFFGNIEECLKWQFKLKREIAKLHEKAVSLTNNQREKLKANIKGNEESEFKSQKY